MDYSNFDYNIEEINSAQLAKISSWSFTTVEGHTSNLVRVKTPKTDMEIDKKELSTSSLTSSESSISLAPDMEIESTTLLEVIDNKNKEISKLKNINYNQRMQLNYYLKKDLLGDNLLSYGHTVNLNVPEEYDSIHFAMARFLKIHQSKSRIMRTYEKLNNLEIKINHLLKRQENLLRKVTVDVLSANAERSLNIKNDKDNNNTLTDNFVSYATQLDIYSKILATTLSVKRELEIMKTYSRRLVAIEEERNSLVDYIYQLPIEQRLNGNYLVSVERDKARLILEISNIRRDQKMLKEKMSKLNHDEEYLKETAKEIKAKSLMLKDNENIITLEEKQQLLAQVEKLREENQQLQEKIQLQQETIENYKNNESKWIEIEGKYRALESQLETLVHQKHEQENELLRLRKIETDYSEQLHTNEVLKKKLAEQRQLEDEMTELKQKIRKFESVKDDHHNYLHDHFGNAYPMSLFTSLYETTPRFNKGLIPNSPNYLQSFYDKLVKIKDMEVEREQMKYQFEDLAKALIQHDSQIRNLAGIINHYGDHKKLQTSSKLDKDNYSNDSYLLRIAQEIMDNVNNCKMSSRPTSVPDPKSSHEPAKCSSHEALKSVFGLDKVCHTSKIIETSQLLSQINLNIENLTETTREFCPKNNQVDESNTILTPKSSGSVNYKSTTNDKNENNTHNKNSTSVTSANLKSKLPVKKNSSQKSRVTSPAETSSECESEVNVDENTQNNIILNASDDFTKLNELYDNHDLTNNNGNPNYHINNNSNNNINNDNRLTTAINTDMDPNNPIVNVQAYKNAEDAYKFYLTFESDVVPSMTDNEMISSGEQHDRRVKLGAMRDYFQKFHLLNDNLFRVD